LMEICQADLRCLDAHSHLGNLFDHRPHHALRYHEVGLRIGELSLGDDFNGVLAWGLIDNRPFYALQCIKQGQCRLRKWGGYMNCGGILPVMNTPALPLSISMPVNSCRMGGAQRNPSVLRFAACSVARMDGFRCAPPILRRYPNLCNASLMQQ
jgi:hypothetical protein